MVIIGSGIAGLMCALSLSKHLKIAILSKKSAYKGSSFYAQGGIAAVLDNSDSIKQHTQDTLNAACGLANKKVVEFMVASSGDAIINLEKYGVKFSKQQGDYHLTTEGGHQVRRVAHIADKTGKSIEQCLLNTANGSNNIKLFEHYFALDLLVRKKVCYGVRVFDSASERVSQFLSRQVVLATGGASKVYFYTSNPDTSTGDGMAMAYRAGCDLINMEFNQFHPTCLYHPEAKSFLISEALRGEGAKLILPNGKQFVSAYDSRAELAPRDIVARAIDAEMKKLGINCVYLDISFKDATWIKQHFPTIYKHCLSFGVDITKQAIPVVPAAHYTCGGIKTNLTANTQIKRLYAIGEVAHTGVHGANRLASNSLLECVVFAKSCADNINNSVSTDSATAAFANWDDSKTSIAKERIIIKHLWDEVRRIMWNFVGIVRNNERLLYAQRQLLLIKEQVETHYQNHKISIDLIELRNLTQVGLIIVKASIARKESRGLYYNTDYPQIAKLAQSSKINKIK